MSKKDISVILPVYNAETTIESTIKSILDQKNINFELIIINDGSTDRTSAILNKFMAIENVNVITQLNKGVSEARNRGIKEARGEFCFFIDSDDRLEDNTLHNMFYSAQNNKLDLVCCDHKEVNSTMSEKKLLNSKSVIALSKVTIAKYYDLFYLQSAWAKLFRLDILKKNNIFFDSNMNLGEDLNFSLRYLQYVKSIGYINSVKYIINNTNPYSLSKKYSENLERDIEVQYKSWEKLIVINPEIKKQYEQKHISFGMYLLKVYFGNLFRFDAPLSKKDKMRKINSALGKHKEWIIYSKYNGNAQTLIDKATTTVILSNNKVLIYLFFYTKEKIRRLMFFAGRKK